jgi:hypothetical protein
MGRGFEFVTHLGSWILAGVLLFKFGLHSPSRDSLEHPQTAMKDLNVL